MDDQLKLMCILAHPDDESLGTGGILAKYADEGEGTYLVTATRGEHGWFGPEEEYPGPEDLARRRERELRAAADALGLREVALLDYEDGKLDQAEPREVIGKIVAHLRRTRPQVVVTFGPHGSYGHPDHIAICQFTTAAIVVAADSGYEDGSGRSPHGVSKLYYLAKTRADLDRYENVFGELVIYLQDETRRAPGWPAWGITTRIDTAAYSQRVWEAVSCHQSQLPNYEALQNLPAAQRRDLWSTQTFYRAFSRVNGGRAVEDDLFAGLRRTVR